MGLDDYLDEEIIQNPMFWLLTAGAEFALLIGFKLQGSLWSAEVEMPLLSKILTLLLVPILGYFITKKITN